MSLARRDLAYLESILQEIQQAETEQLSSIGRLTALICGERFNEKDYAAQLSELEL